MLVEAFFNSFFPIKLADTPYLLQYSCHRHNPHYCKANNLYLIKLSLNPKEQNSSKKYCFGTLNFKNPSL